MSFWQEAFRLKHTLFHVPPCAEQVLHPPLGLCKWFHRGLEPMQKGLHGLHWNPKFGLCWGLKKCHLHSWSALDWSGNVTHITGSCLQHGPLFSWFFDLHSRPPMMVPAGGPPPGSLFANGLPMAVLFLVLFLCCWCSLPWFWPVGTEGSEAQHVMLGVRKTSKKRCFWSVGCPSKQALHLWLGPCKWLHHRGSELNLMVKVERNLRGIMNWVNLLVASFVPSIQSKFWILLIEIFLECSFLCLDFCLIFN